MICEQVPLAGYTTLGLGGPAARFVEASSDDQVISAVRAADQRGDPVLILGGGSNLVIADAGFPGTVVRVATRGIAASPDGDRMAVSVAAGEDWDTVVRWCIGSGLSGLECLSGIPGLAGATPIQNVGAYGQDVAQQLIAVRAYDRRRGMTTVLSNADCGFGYRTSAFKRAAAVTASLAGAAGLGLGVGDATGRYVVLGVTFRLASDPLSGPVWYPELARSLGVAEGGRVPLADARDAVLRLRRGKGMVLDPADPDTRSAGSFFTNPVLDQQQLATLEKTVAAGWGASVAVPRFAAEPGRVKIPAAWLIEHAGFGKGYPDRDRQAAARERDRPERDRPERDRPERDRPERNRPERNRDAPGPRISTKHTLALVNPGGATTASLLALAREIRDGVRDTFGVELVSEPALVGARL